MVKAIIFDCDGPVIKRDMYFTRRLVSEGINIKMEKVLPFFEGDFILCETGKKDLKQELKKVFKDWGWKGSVEELMDYWFRNEAEKREEMLKYIKELRSGGVKCYLATDNEKYRVAYLLDTVGLREHFDGFFPSCEIGYLKKQKKFWQAAYRNLDNYRKDEILVWDDDLKNVNRAKEFGFLAEQYENFGDFEAKMGEYVE